MQHGLQCALTFRFSHFDASNPQHLIPRQPNPLLPFTHHCPPAAQAKLSLAPSGLANCHKPNSHLCHLASIYTFKWKEKAPSLQRCLGFRLLVYKSTMQLYSMQFASKIKNLNETTNLKDLARNLDPTHCNIRCL